jgi:5-methylcytosine-specific restriction protein B
MGVQEVYRACVESTLGRFFIALRKRRAPELRSILAEPQAIQLETFNKEVWAIESRTVLHPSGENIKVTAQESADDIPSEWWEALQANQLELHGNYLWRPASSIFAPQSKNDREKLDALQSVTLILNDADMSPIAKAHQLMQVKGLGESTATGLVMVFHPESFAIRNKQSRAALVKLNIHEDSLESFQGAVAELRQTVGAEDFLKLDFFLYQVAQGNADLMTMKPADAWLFQANPGLFDLEESLQSLKDGDKDDWSVSRYRDEMKIGDHVVLWQGGPTAGIYALGTLIGLPFQRPTADFWPDREQREPTEWAVPFHYTQILREPISKAVLSEHPVLKDIQVIRAPQGTNFKVTPDQWEALEDLLDSRGTVVVPRRDSGGRGVKEPSAPTIADLADVTHLDQPFLREIENLLTDKKQLIFEGPPGSGKTFVAEKFARYITGQPLVGDRNEQIELIQFHQSYSYEDFVEGIRPTTNDASQLVYQERDGVFLTFAKRAEANKDKKFVLIIDEINRGNVSRILGELMLLLEYREQTATLPYSKQELRIPDNLYIIGTMNSADRSLSQIDYALRRRFYFVPFMSVENGKATVLGRWLQAHAPQSMAAVPLFVALNHQLRQHMGTDDLQVGHSYFMRTDIHTDTVQQQVWKYAVMPLLREYLYHHRDRDTLLQQYTLAVLNPPIVPVSQDEAATETRPEDVG